HLGAHVRRRARRRVGLNAGCSRTLGLRMPSPALEIRGLVKRFRDPSGGVREAVSVEALDLGAGEEMALAGDSGRGKTKLLHVISGILDADEGRVSVGGEEMTGLSEAARDRLRARRVG